MKHSTMPKPKIDTNLADMIRQCNVAINLFEMEDDVLSLVKAMKERNELLRQAIEESTK